MFDKAFIFVDYVLYGLKQRATEYFEGVTPRIYHAHVLELRITLDFAESVHALTLLSSWYTTFQPMLDPTQLIFAPVRVVCGG